HHVFVPLIHRVVIMRTIYRVSLYKYCIEGVSGRGSEERELKAACRFSSASPLIRPSSSVPLRLFILLASLQSHHHTVSFYVYVPLGSEARHAQGQASGLPLGHRRARPGPQGRACRRRPWPRPLLQCALALLKAPSFQ